jgi:hypothetical protein
MTVRAEGKVIHLEGSCRVEEAEMLLTLLQSGDGRVIDLSACDHLHAALVQLLLVFKPEVRSECRDEFTRSRILPSLLRVPRQAR